MQPSVLPLRERFREAGRAVLRHPKDPRRHETRVTVACELDGAEPLQGALVDLLYACEPDAERHVALLSRSSVRERLPVHACNALLRQVRSNVRLPAANALATRWSVLASPSLDVPRRALLCSTDDARVIAAQVIPALLAGDIDIELAFLAHCEGAGDALAFMLARRALTRQGRVLSSEWARVMGLLQPGADA